MLRKGQGQALDELDSCFLYYSLLFPKVKLRSYRQSPSVESMIYPRLVSEIDLVSPRSGQFLVRRHVISSFYLYLMFISNVAFSKVFAAQYFTCSYFFQVRSLSINSAINRSLRKSRCKLEKSSRSKSLANSLKRSQTAIVEATSNSKNRSSPTASQLSTSRPLYLEEGYSPLSNGRRHGERKHSDLEKAWRTEAALRYPSPRFDSASKRTKNIINPPYLASSVRYEEGIQPHHDHRDDPESANRNALFSDNASLKSSKHRFGKNNCVDVEKESPRHPHPLAIPYTTSASEFLYGTSVIKAALNAKKRKFYNLYIYDGENRKVHDQDAGIRKLAVATNVVVQKVKGKWLQLMDRMSQGRPHNVRWNIYTYLEL